MLMIAYFCGEVCRYLAKYRQARRQFDAGGYPRVCVCEYMPIHKYYCTQIKIQMTLS